MRSPAKCQRCARRVPWLAWFGNLGLTIYKVVVGLLGRSPALIADGIHSFTDVIGTSVIIFSTRISERPANSEYQYGYGKAEFLSSMFIYIVLIGIAGVIFAGSLSILLAGHEEPPGVITVFGGLISILYNVIMYRLGQCAGQRTNSPALLANSFENRADAISSVAVCIGIVLAITVHPACDPIAGIIVALIIIINCGQEMKKALAGLMDQGLPLASLARIRAVAGDQDSVAGVSFIRSRPTGSGYWLDLGIEVKSGTSVSRAEEIAENVRERLMERSRHFSHIEVYVEAQTA